MLIQAKRWLFYLPAAVLLMIVLCFHQASAQPNDDDGGQGNFSIFLPLISQSGIIPSAPTTADSEAVIFTDGAVSPVANRAYTSPIPLALQEEVQSSEHRSQADVQLTPLDVDHLLREDRVDNQKKNRRIGIVRPLGQDITAAAQAALGVWQVTKDGRRFWTLTIDSPGAYAIRVHLENVQLPLGAQIIVYNTANAAEAYGPYTIDDFNKESDLWTTSIFSSRVTLEVLVPPTFDDNQPLFLVRELSHLYANPDTLMRPMEGSCHNDVTCHSNWSTQAQAVALYTFIANDGSAKLCSGALLNDLDTDTFEDYFLTAHHCVSTQAVASSTEFYWLYQTATCNGTPPSLTSVPRTNGGADLISASSTNDHSFLRIRNETPGGLVYLGWTTAALSQGQDLVGMHHPDGAYKRISFGDLDTSDTNFWVVVWHDGVTEKGSSGSPVFNIDKRVVGQLQGGDSSCSEPDSPDDYGRFDKTYSSIQRWLAIGGTINVNSAYTGVEQGTPTQPFRTTIAANNFAWNGSRIRFKAGSYPGAITFNRTLTLIATGGTVTIGN